MHDSPLGESQMEVHIEFLMDVLLHLGSAMGEEKMDVRASSMETVVVDTYPHKMLEVDGIVLREASIQQDHEIPNQERDDVLDMVEHPSSS